MKVYTHYYKVGEDEGLRWRTLLQFGHSFEIIGSVVMKNPGSSKPKDSKVITNDNLLSGLSKFDDSSDAWYEFTDDDTMRKVAVLFASYYGMDNVNQLKGIIQIFNLFYIMDPDEQRAEQKMKDAGLPANFHTPKDLLDYDIRHLVAPVYLGFGDLAFSETFGDSAKSYFDSVINSHPSSAYLNEIFEANSFYHPQYLCGNGCNNHKSIRIRGLFKKSPLTEEQIENDGVALPKLRMSKEEQWDIINDLREGYAGNGLVAFQYNSRDFKTIRFLLPHDLQITVTSTGKGYVGIRHLPPQSFNYYTDNYPDKEWLDYLIIEKYGFMRNVENKAWIGVKPLDDFGDASSIFSFIREFGNHELFKLSSVQRKV